MASANSSIITETKNGNNKAADQNNNDKNIELNNNKENQENQKLTYDFPSDYKFEIHQCICERPQKVFECGRCHHYFHGRIGVTCKVHPKTVFLMDFYDCPYCFSPTSNVVESPLSWDQVRKIEEGQLPDDSDGL